MKKTVFVIMLLVGASLVSSAQQQRQRLSPEERTQRQVEQLQESLKLTPEQKSKVVTILTAQSKSIDSLRQAANGDFQSMRGKMAPIQENTEKQIKAVLTDEQAKKYDSYIQERRSRMQQGGQRRGSQGN